MPFRRRRRFRKFRPRKRFYRRRGYVPRLRPEHKYANTQLTASFSSVGNAWVEYDLLSPITAGTSPIAERIGRKISVIGVQIKGLLFGAATGFGGADDYFNSVRICVLGFHADKGGSSLSPLSTAGIGINNPITRTNTAGLSHIFRDNLIALTNPPYGSNLCAPGHRSVNIFIRFRKPLVVDFTGGTAHYNQYQLYLSMISDSTAIPNPGFASGWTRLIYTDV